MINPFNPYSPLTEDNLFFGEKRNEELNSMARQIHLNGYSYVVLAGDKMGKTSFLLKLLDILERSSFEKMKLVIIYINLSHMMPLSPYIFLQGILDSAVKHFKKSSEFDEIKYEDYKLIQERDIKFLFDDFIDSKLKKLLREGEEVFGKLRLVLLIDDAKHLVTGQDWSEAMYHQLRYLFVDSPLSSKISSVLTGFRKIRDLREEVGSPFNHMQSRYLEGLSYEDCRLMLKNTIEKFKGTGFNMEDELSEKIYNLTGGHPFLLTTLFSVLWDKIPPLNINILEEAADEIYNLENIFQTWDKKLDDNDRGLYSHLLKTNFPVAEEHIRNTFKVGWKDSIEVLSSMGLIKKKRENSVTYYKSSCEFFRKWFLISTGMAGDITDLAAQEKKSDSAAADMRFFVYKNGVRNISESQICRKIIEEALKGEGLYRLVIDRAFSDGLVIHRDKRVSVGLPGKIPLDLLTYLAVNHGIFQSFSRIGYALWQEEFTPKVNIQNVKSIMVKELGKRGIDTDEIILSKRGGYMFSELIDVCVINIPVIRCGKCGNPSDINMNRGRCTNSECNAVL